MPAAAGDEAADEAQVVPPGPGGGQWNAESRRLAVKLSGEVLGVAETVHRRLDVGERRVVAVFHPLVVTAEQCGHGAQAGCRASGWTLAVPAPRFFLSSARGAGVMLVDPPEAATDRNGEPAG